jgi:hypothetical protein
MSIEVPVADWVHRLLTFSVKTSLSQVIVMNHLTPVNQSCTGSESGVCSARLNFLMKSGLAVR